VLSRSSKSLFKKDTQDRLKGDLARVSTYSLVDGAGSSDAVEKELMATPALTLPINLVNYFPPLKAVNDSLSNVCGELSVGQFAVTFNFDHFTVIGGLDGPRSADYGDLRYAGKQVSREHPVRHGGNAGASHDACYLQNQLYDCHLISF
jgi:hypothetical protein